MEDRKPVVRASSTLSGETLVWASALLAAGFVISDRKESWSLPDKTLRMDKETLVRRKRNYGWASILLILAVYIINQMGSLIVGQGGTDQTSATLMVALNAAVSFALVACIVMWFLTGQKLKRI